MTFGDVPDPDPWIHTLDYESGSFSFVSAFKETKKCFLVIITVGTFTLVLKDSKSLRSHISVELKGFSLSFGLVMEVYWSKSDPDK